MHVPMNQSSCLTVGCGLPLLAFAVLIGWAVTFGGYSLDDPEIEEQLFWVQDFKADEPELSRQMARQCAEEIGRSPWTRDGAMALFSCVRAKAEAQGYSYPA